MHEVGARHLPRIAVLEPGVGPLDLPAIRDLLREEAALIAHTVAVGGQSQVRHAVEQARREPSEPAVAERRIDLELGEGREIEAVFRQCLPECLVETEIPESLREKPARQELHREIIDSPLSGRAWGADIIDPIGSDTLAHQARHGAQPLPRTGGVGRTAGHGLHLSDERKRIALRHEKLAGPGTQARPTGSRPVSPVGCP